MLPSDFVQNAAFHDELAPQYDTLVRANSYNTLAREVFVELVTRHVSPGSTILDFGCGTGIDALKYAQKGYHVLAYDNSPGMVAQLEQRCQSELASGRINAWSEGYPSFLLHFPQFQAPSAVVGNFAVLNSIRALTPLFETFACHLASPGWIIISILNPLHWLKLKTPRWWLKGLWEGNGSPVYVTQPFVTYLHFVQALLQAAPQFRLIGRANSGKFVRYDEVTPGHEKVRSWWGQTDVNRSRLERALWYTPAHRMLGHFVFLVLRRDL